MNKNKSRSQQSIKNASFSFVCQLLQLAVQLITRIFFIRTIGREYLGLNSLFTDMLTMLQLVELGIGPAIAYSLYKPLADDDTEKVKSIMRIFKKAYYIIGVLILVLGIGFTPFVGFFIDKDINIPNIGIIYILFVINTGVSYFFSYYRTLLISDQKKYLDISIQTIVTIICLVAQIFILCYTKNYLLFVIAHIFNTILTNVIAARVTIKNYPFLKDKNVKKLDKTIGSQIKKNIFAMMFHKIGGIMRDATDNLLISKFLGLAITGMYSNYSMIIKALTTIITQLFAAVLSSVGNLNVVADEKRKQIVFYNINFINFWIAAFFSCCFGILINPFITIIADETYLLEFALTITITYRFFFDMMRKTPWMFCEAAGIYWKGKFKPLLEIVVNVISSIILVKLIGISGIFVGTIITILVVDLTIEPFLVFKYVLKCKRTSYYLKYILYTIVFSIMAFSSYYICSLIPGSGLFTFVLKTIVTAIVSNVVICLFMFKTKEFKYVINLFKNYKERIKGKLKNRVTSEG